MGTTLGLLWPILYPIIFLGLYSLVYIFILGVKIPNYSHFGYVLLIFSGLIPFLGFTEALSTGTSSVITNKNLIKNTLFPVELIPVKAVFNSSITMLVGLVLLLTVLVSKGMVFPSQLMVFVYLILQIIFTIGVVWIFSALNVFFQDFSQLVNILNIVLMLVSPIGYTIDMIPHHLLFLMYPNPLFYMIMLYRCSLIQGVVPMGILAVFAVMSFLVFTIGYFMFSRLKLVFSDYV
jgi:lipopolysaccharide transport system permease protein